MECKGCGGGKADIVEKKGEQRWRDALKGMWCIWYLNKVVFAAKVSSHNSYVYIKSLLVLPTESPRPGSHTLGMVISVLRWLWRQSRARQRRTP